MVNLPIAGVELPCAVRRPQGIEFWRAVNKGRYAAEFYTAVEDGLHDA